MNNTRPTDAVSDKRAGLFSRLTDSAQIVILDWLVLLAFGALFAVIYIPQSIWQEEDRDRNESRRRMQILSDTEEIYRIFSGGAYSLDGDFLFKLVSQTHDSLIGDSTFFGTQTMHVDGDPIQITIPKNFLSRLDTTYSVGRKMRHTLQDTTYVVRMFDSETGNLDTVYVNGQNVLVEFLGDPDYRGIMDTTFGEHSEIYIDYSWNRYHLTADLLNSPVTGENYLISFDSTQYKLTITNPIPRKYSELRYGLFRYRPAGFGWITGGSPSWGEG